MHAGVRRQAIRLDRRALAAAFDRRAIASGLVGLYRLAAWRDLSIVGPVVVTLLLVIAHVVYVERQIPTLPILMPLHYNGAGVVDLIGPRENLLRMPLIGLLVLAFDVAVGARTYRTDPLAARILAGTALLVEILLFVATTNIVRLAFG